MPFGFGVDIGGTKCAITLAEFTDTAEQLPKLVDHCHFATRVEDGYEKTIGAIMNALDALADKHQVDMEHETVGIGIVCGGPLDSGKGTIMQPPNLYNWENVPIVELFQERYHTKVFLENDANACAIAEYKFGAGVGKRNIVFLTFGTGLGAGLILDGRIYRGTNGMAGEVGHIRLSQYGPVGFGKAGSFEGFCSGGGIMQIARMKLTEIMQQGKLPDWCDTYDKIESLNAKIIAEHAERGDEVAIDIYRTSGKALGAGLSVLIDILNPERIIIGSVFARSTNLLWPYAKEVIDREALALSSKVCEVVPSKLGDSVGDYAAISLLV